MAHHWSPKPGWFAFTPLLLLIILAMACGTKPTPTSTSVVITPEATTTPSPTAIPTPTPIPPEMKARLASRLSVMTVAIAVTDEGLLPCVRRGVIDYYETNDIRRVTFSGCDLGDGIIVQGSGELKLVGLERSTQDRTDRITISRIIWDGGLTAVIDGDTEVQINKFEIGSMGMQINHREMRIPDRLQLDSLTVSLLGETMTVDDKTLLSQLFDTSAMDINSIPNPSKSMSALTESDMKRLAYHGAGFLFSFLLNEVLESQRGSHSHEYPCGTSVVTQNLEEGTTHIENTWNNCGFTGSGTFIDGAFSLDMEKMDETPGLMTMIVKGDLTIGGAIPKITIRRLEWSHERLTSIGERFSAKTHRGPASLPTHSHISGKIEGETDERSFSFTRRVREDYVEPPVPEWVGWVRQSGSDDPDMATSVAVDGEGNVYVAGWTEEVMPGNATVRSVSAFLRRYDPTGEDRWTRQFGSSEREIDVSIAVDVAGSIYVAGTMTGAPPGEASEWRRGAFLRKYAPTGEERWTRQFGSAGDDEANGVAVDAAGNIYVAGNTSGTLPGQASAGSRDVFLRKYDPSGEEIWTRQFGSTVWDGAQDVAVNREGNVYVVGETHPGQTNERLPDAFLSKYDPAGEVLWTRQFGPTGRDGAESVAVDAAGNIYVAGNTSGTLPGQIASGGSADGYLRKYDPSGEELWTRQFGTGQRVEAESVAVDGEGNIHVVGSTHPGQTNEGFPDAFLRKFDPAGEVLWTRQLGSHSRDVAEDVAVDIEGNVYVAGWTVAGLPGQPFVEGVDAFVVQVAP